MLEKILLFFDKLEDKTRRWLSHRPLLYALIGGVGVVLFWRGIWHIMDFLMAYYFAATSINRSVDISSMLWWDAPLSALIGLIMLMLTGIFTSSFIGNEIIISGIKGEKKMVEKTEAEMQNETESLKSIRKKLNLFLKKLKNRN